MTKIGVGIGLVFGLAPVVLGAVALATTKWLTITTELPTPSTKLYTVLNKGSGSLIPEDSLFNVVKGFQIAGVATIFVGLLASVFVHLVVQSRFLRFLPALLISAGPILILIGLLMFAVIVFEDAGKNLKADTKIEYSLILMVICCILGFLTSTVFAFLSGFNAYSHPKLSQRQFPTSTEF